MLNLIQIKSLIRTALSNVYNFCCKRVLSIKTVIREWFTGIKSISLTSILIYPIYIVAVCWWHLNFKLKPLYRKIRKIKRWIKKITKWTLNKIIILLSPISAMLYSITDYRWLTFYIIVLAKLYDNLCKREDEREYYENYYEEQDDEQT